MKLKPTDKCCGECRFWGSDLDTKRRRVCGIFAAVGLYTYAEWGKECGDFEAKETTKVEHDKAE